MAQIDVKFMKGTRVTARKMGDTYRKTRATKKATTKKAAK